jgi:hypothetical protein
MRRRRAGEDDGGMNKTLIVTGLVLGTLLVLVVALALTSSSYTLTFTPVSPSEPFGDTPLERALGDQPDEIGGTYVSCSAAAGRTVAGRRYNWVCDKQVYEGLCAPGTGERDSTLYVLVTGRRHAIVKKTSSGDYTPCASVA